MEKAIFHAMHQHAKPTVKELNESLAFVNATRSGLKGLKFDVVLDVAGGHGAVAALFLCLAPGVEEAVVIDPAEVSSGKLGVGEGILPFVKPGKVLTYRTECLRTGLPAELERCRGRRVLVVACHACQHLTDEVVGIALQHGASGISVMPCCHKDRTGGAWKAAAKAFGVNIGTCMDLVLAGRLAPEGRLHGFDYEVRMRIASKTSTPQNRIVIGRRMDGLGGASAAAPGAPPHSVATEAAHERLTRAYDRAHRPREPTAAAPAVSAVRSAAAPAAAPTAPARRPAKTDAPVAVTGTWTAWRRVRSRAGEEVAARLSWEIVGRFAGCIAAVASVAILGRALVPALASTEAGLAPRRVAV